MFRLFARLGFGTLCLEGESGNLSEVTLGFSPGTPAVNDHPRL